MEEMKTVVLQEVEYNAKGDLPDSLFFSGNINKQKNGFEVIKGEKVSFDSYFNLFSLRKLKKYTNVQSVQITMEITGRAILSGIAITENGKRTKVFNHIIDSNGMQVIEATELLDIRDLPDYIYIEIKAETNLAVKKIRLIGKPNHINDVSMACCFCTYKREAELKQNVDNIFQNCIKSNKSERLIDIYIADNGNTIIEKNIIPENEHIKIFRNKNYGGSAGFTRCLIESAIKNPGKYTHVLLMDDDALIEPYVIERTYALLCVVNEKYRDSIVGGALLSKENPILQKENGAYLGNYGNVHINGKNVLINNLRNIINNENNEQKNYNGWFYCCIPSHIIREDNLPLPLFIHGDDQEYGKRSGQTILTMNGIAVWHPDPNSNHRPYMNYYDQRNALIIASEFEPKLSARRVCKELFKTCMQKVAKYQYEDAWYIIRGFDDYYRGINRFLKVKPDDLNKEIMGWKKYKPYQIDKDKDSFETPSSKSKSSRVRRKIINYFLPATIGKKIYSHSSTWEEIDNFRVKELCVVNKTTGQGFVLKKSYRESFRIICSLVSCSFSIMIHHKMVYSEWCKGISMFKTINYWSRSLEI